MAGNTRPIYPKAPFITSSLAGSGVFNDRTTTGTTDLSSLIASQSDDLLIDSILIKSINTGTISTGGLIRLWLYNGSGNATMIREVSAPSNYTSDTTANLAWSTTLNYDDFVLPVGWSLWTSKTWAYPIIMVINGGFY